VAYPRSCAAEGGDERGGAQATDASGAAPFGFKPYWTAPVERRTRGLRSDEHVCWMESTVGNLTARDTWHASERWTLDAAFVAVATDAFVAPEKCPVKGQRLYSFVGL
jgi:hypothetical protein